MNDTDFSIELYKRLSRIVYSKNYTRNPVWQVIKYFLKMMGHYKDLPRGLPGFHGKKNEGEK